MVRRALALYRMFDSRHITNDCDASEPWFRRRRHDAEKTADNMKCCKHYTCSNAYKREAEGPSIADRRRLEAAAPQAPCEPNCRDYARGCCDEHGPCEA